MAIIVIFPVQGVLEEGRDYNLGKGYAMRFDRGNTPGVQDHLHFFKKGAELYAINRDGTAHDGYHGSQMHNHPVKKAKALFPDFNWPTDNLLEDIRHARTLPGFIEYLTEGRRTALLAEAIIAADAIIQELP